MNTVSYGGQLHVCSHKKERGRERETGEEGGRRQKERGGSDKFIVAIAQLFSLCQ
jgi:hypothetical protein